LTNLCVVEIDCNSEGGAVAVQLQDAPHSLDDSWPGRRVRGADADAKARR